MASPTTGLCPDWVLSNNSNVHVARDRGWYSTYTPFQTYATTFMAGERIEAVGIGDVELPVKVHLRNRPGRNMHGTLRLRNVLHVPTARCNIVGGPSTGDYEGLQLGMPQDNGMDGELRNSDGRRIAYLHCPHNLFLIKLSGPPVGPVLGESLLTPNGIHMIHALWPSSERARWAAAQTASNAPGGTSTQTGDASEPPYTAEEKEFLKQHWGGEFQFLILHGLSIYKEEDREEGRRILRAIMEDDRAWVNNDDSSEDEVDSLEGHMADYHFTEEELDFIEGGWGNTANFMLTYGLKFYNDEDCEEAKAIVRVLMAESDNDADSEDEVNSDDEPESKRARQ